MTAMTPHELAMFNLGKDNLVRGLNDAIEAIEKRLEYELPFTRKLVERLSPNEFLELLNITNLAFHYIDTEEKFAKKIFGEDYMKVWMRSVRKRLRRQNPPTTTPTKKAVKKPRRKK